MSSSSGSQVSPQPHEVNFFAESKLRNPETNITPRRQTDRVTTVFFAPLWEAAAGAQQQAIRKVNFGFCRPSKRAAGYHLQSGFW